MLPSESRLPDFLETLGDVVWVAQADTLRFSFVSVHPDVALGHPAEHWRKMGFFSAQLHRKDRDRVLRALRAVAEDGVPRMLEHRFLSDTGESRWFHTQVRAVRTRRGPVRQLLGIMDQIARPTGELGPPSEDEARIRLMLEQIPAVLWTTDADLRFTSMSGAGLAAMGISLEEVIGQTVPEHFPSEGTAQLIVAAHRRALEGEPATFGAEWSGRLWHGRVEPLRDPTGGPRGTVAVALDITARREAEEALRQSEERFRLLLEGVRDCAIFTLDAKGFVTSWNEGAERLTGFRADELVDRHFSWFYEDADLRVRKPARTLQAAAQQGSFQEEGWRLRKDRTRVWAEVTITALRDAAGGLTGFSHVMRDATERREVEASLRQGEQRLRLLVEQLPAILWTTDLELRITSAEGAALSALAPSPEEIVGRTLFDYFRTEDRAFPPIAAHLGALRGEHAGFEIAAEGRVFQAHVRPFLDLGGRIAGTLGTALEVTERKQAEDERDRLLREEHEARERTAFLYRATGQLIEHPDLENRLNHLAQAAVPTLGDLCAVVLVEPDGSLRRAAVHVDPSIEQVDVLGAPEIEESVRRALSSGMAVLHAGTPPAKGEAPPERGPLRPHSHLSVPLIARGKTLGAITFASARESGRYGPSLLVLAQDLAGRAALALDNARLFREAQEAVAAREELLAVASHELRNPTHALVMSLHVLAQIAERGAGGAEAPALSRAVESSLRQGRRLAKLLDNLLDLSRLAGQGIELDLAEVDLAAAVGEVAEAFQPQLAQAGCEIAVHAPAPVVGRWDRLRLEEVVTNLLANALRFGAGRPIEVVVMERDGRAVLTVVDHGIGIPLEEQVRVFDRFVRTEPGGRRGLGLGLYISRRIVEAHGGTITVESVPGRGATFRVELPVGGPGAK